MSKALAWVLLALMSACAYRVPPHDSEALTDKVATPDWSWHLYHTESALRKRQEALWGLCEELSRPLPYQASPKALRACILTLKP